MKIGKHIVSFFVASNPLPKQSFRKGKYNYIPKRIMDWERTVRDYAKVAMIDKEPYEDRVHVDYRFLRENKRRVDLGNLEKAVSDAMNKVVYLDDSQIKSMRMTLGYNKEQPGVWVEVCELEE